MSLLSNNETERLGATLTQQEPDRSPPPPGDANTVSSRSEQAAAPAAADSQSVSRSDAQVRVLMVEHNPDDVALSVRALKAAGFTNKPAIAATKEEFVRIATREEFDVILADYNLPNWNGLDVLALARKLRMPIPVILLSGTIGEELAVECIKKGISDYVLKHQLQRLSIAIRRALEDRRMREDRTRAEETLREREDHYRTLVENAPEAIVVFDVDKGVFVDGNHCAEELFGISRSGLFTRAPWDVSPAIQPDGRSSAEEVRKQIDNTLRGEVSNFEWVFRNSDGKEIPCEVSLCVLPSGRRRLVRGSIVDIGERKRAEIALRESEARYRTLFESATFGLYRVTLDGKLLDVNPAIVAMLGYDSAEDLLAINLSDELYVHPSDRLRLLEQLRREAFGDAIVEWKRKDGKRISVRLVGHPGNDPKRGADCLEVMVEDVTEHLALEKKLHQAQKFEAFGQLAGGIAHDFNNMIGAILGWAELGLDETSADAVLHKRFEKIRLQAERAAALTRQLLAFARRQTLEPRHVDLNQILEETLSLLDNVIGSNIEMKMDLAPGLAMVRADPTQIEQVVMNLCVNARDAMPDGGLITVRTRNTEFDEEFCRKNPQARPGRQVLLSVSDTGVGMDATTLDRVFEPFFTTKGPSKGTGLGLATAYGIVKQHGGLVLVDSEVGKGTTFRIFLPVSRDSSVHSNPSSAGIAASGGTETILVVEDHEGLRDLARETLAHLGYNVVVATDGEEALELFRKNAGKIDLALLDVMLPRLSGVDVYDRIRAVKPRLPVIFATGYTTAGTLASRLESSGCLVILKPYSRGELAKRIRETLEASRAAPES
ncbi:MAG TPA: response regulator [Candidatus Acidoferrales bacterium]|nr:response regulator [Candidatus Acidoferrales bacterium]